MGRVAAVLVLALLACAAGTGCGSDEDVLPSAEPPPASEAPTVEEAAAEATSVFDPDEPLGPGCYGSVDLLADPPSRDQALVNATIVGAESAPPGLTYWPPDDGWSDDGPSIPCIADAWATAFYGGGHPRAIVDLSLATDEATARRAIANARVVLGFSDGAEVERPADGPGDERVTITGDGVAAVLWRRERFVAAVLLQDATEPGTGTSAATSGATSADASVWATSAALVAAQDARITEALAGP